MMSETNEQESGFYLSKWYADLIDEQTGDLTIIYLGEMKWNFIKIPFTNILRFLQRHELLSHASFSVLSQPELDNGSLRINTERITGQWTTRSSSITERLYENTDGYIHWECWMPCAEGQITINDRIYQGLGYVERLTLTLKPWQLPMDNLRWGRFVSSNHSIVWIQWQGNEEKCLIFHNGTKHIQGIITDEEIQFDNYRLNLTQKYTLRDGPVSKTVFKRYTWIKRLFPSNFLSHLIECKWQTWSQFYEDDHLRTEGWSIHENVNIKPRWNLLGKISYGALFTVLIPLLLVFWSKRTEYQINLPVPEYPALGLFLFVFGVFLMISAMIELWFVGNGLPMNAYPPPTFVNTGVYYFMAHPIYIGSSMISFGLSIYFESRSGFWLISTCLTLAWLALVHGYENENLQQRFPQINYHPFFHLPDDLDSSLELSDRISAYGLVLFPWLILYETIIFIGIPHDPLSTYLPYEQMIPVMEWTTIFYALAYPYVILLPLILQTKQQLRSFMIDGWMNLAIGIYCQFVFPFIAQPKSFTPTNIFGHLLEMERHFDGANGACPSFHVSWAFLSAYHYTYRFPRCKIVFYLLAIVISISCMTTGMHSLIDVLTGWLLFFICIRRDYLLSCLRNGYEYLANSWSAYQLGYLRILSHSFYAGSTGFIGYLLLCSLLGNIYVIFIVSCSSIICAAIWGQFIEQASGLSRPFGYFGCILGGVLSSIISSYVFHIPIIAIIATFALISPWIQAGGRTRCIIQGCCHGRPTTNFAIGIVVNNPKSRVCSLSKLNNIPVHPTAGYSIVANIILGILLWRLWYSNVSLNLIISLYMILIGLSRFVEETFRGEVQTPVYFNLKIYQWMSIIFVLSGIVITMIPMNDSTRLNFHCRLIYLIPSILFGFFAAFVLGMDFPESKRRFSRLTD